MASGSCSCRAGQGRQEHHREGRNGGLEECERTQDIGVLPRGCLPAVHRQHTASTSCLPSRRPTCSSTTALAVLEGFCPPLPITFLALWHCGEGGEGREAQGVMAGGGRRFKTGARGWGVQSGGQGCQHPTRSTQPAQHSSACLVKDDEGGTPRVIPQPVDDLAQAALGRGVDAHVRRGAATLRVRRAGGWCCAEWKSERSLQAAPPTTPAQQEAVSSGGPPH